MTSIEFQEKLRELDPRFSVVENPNRVGLSNIFYSGMNYDLPVISTNEIREEVDQAYGYRFPNGMQSRYWTQSEVLDRCKDFLKAFKEGKFKDLYE